MSKQNYAVCCYTCEHNGQETCKGCNTILNGKNEPYENWQLREDLCQKDEQIADLQHRLEVAERATKLACEEMDDSGCVAICNYCPYNLQEICPNECPQSTILLEKYFKEQAARIKELEEVLKKTNTNNYLTDYYLVEKENQQLKQAQKQLAIEELEKLREYIVLNDKYDEEIGCNIIETFDLIEGLADKIKSLKGEK